MARHYTQVYARRVAKPRPESSPLLEAVQALDDELARFEQLAHAAGKVPLTSERNLEKAARAINDAADSQRRVNEHIQRLIEAISAARTTHDAVAETLVKTRDDVQARADRFTVQLGRLSTLGKEAAEVSGLVRQLGALKERPNAEVVAQLSDVRDRMAHIVDGAGRLGAEAEADAMEDLARQCDSLKQQVQSALNKVSLLREKLAAQLS